MSNFITVFLGFQQSKEIKIEYPDTFVLKDSLGLKLDYLKSLETQESARTTTIESKTSQLIGQTSVVFSLLGLFISNYLSKFNSLPVGLQISLVITFLIAVIFYLFTIFNATKYLKISNYAYGQRSTTTVKSIFKSDDDFKLEEIKDLIYCIEKNIQVTNNKSVNLLNAYQNFKIATFFVGILSVILLISGYFLSDSSPKKVVIDNPVIVKNLDSNFHQLLHNAIPKIVIIHDTIYR
jgi:hypothetical protein